MTCKSRQQLLFPMAVILTYLAWVVGLLALQAESSVALNPGFRTIITQKGLDYGML